MRPVNSLQPATAGSCALDIPCPKEITILPAQCPYKLKSGIKGPIPPGTVGLITGRSSLTIKGITVHMGLIDSDSIGEIIIVISVPTVWTFKKGEHIAQLLLVPFVMPGTSERRRIGSFGSTNPKASANPLVAFTSNITQAERPIITLDINGKKFKGMIDTGADISIISKLSWPRNWALEQVPHGLSGIGSLPPSSVRQSVRRLKCIGPEEQVATFQPYVAPMELNLWGRDLQEQWGAQFYMPPSDNPRTPDSEVSPF